MKRHVAITTYVGIGSIAALVWIYGGRVVAQNRNNINRVQRRERGTCVQCHNRTGIYSVNCFTRFISFFFPPDGETTHLIQSAPEHAGEVTVDWKQQQFNWGLLQSSRTQAN